MTFDNVIQQPIHRSWAYFKLATADQNPTSGYTAIGDRRVGRFADNTGTVPVRGHAMSLGTLSQTLVNTDAAFEAPTITPLLMDPVNAWRQLATTGYTLKNRWAGIYIRSIDPTNGTVLEQEIARGVITDDDFPPRQAQLTVEFKPWTLFGERLPRPTFTLEDWPYADPEVLGKPIPIYYGRVEGGFSPQVISALAVALATAPSGFSGLLTTGGIARSDQRIYYGLTSVSGAVESEPTIIGPFQAHEDMRRVALSWPSDGKTHRLYRGASSTLGDLPENRLYTSASGTTLPSWLTSVNDDWIGFSNIGHYDPGIPWQAYWTTQSVRYFISAMVDGVETEMSPSAPVLMMPTYPRNVAITWTPLTNASSYILRRRSEGIGPIRFDREWIFAPAVLSYTDANTSTTEVTLHEDYRQRTGGRVPAYLVDSNEHRYVISGPRNKSIREVFVFKSPRTEEGGEPGEVPPPRELTAAIVGTPGASRWRYRVTTLTANGESEPTDVVFAEAAPADLGEADYVHLAWAAAEGGERYRIYGRTLDQELHAVGETDNLEFNDQGGEPNAEIALPLHDTTSDAAQAERATPVAQPIPQIEGTDYVIEVIEKNGKRFHTLKFTESQGTDPVTVNLWGIESVGDSTGTLLEHPADVWQHLLLNFVANDWRTGVWYANTAYRTGFIDTASIAATKSLMPSGYVVNGGLFDTVVPVEQVLWEFLSTFDMDFYFDGVWKTDYLTTDVVVDVTTLTPFTMQDGIARETFKCREIKESHANIIPYVAGPPYGGQYIVGGEYKDESAITDYGGEIRAQPVMLTWTLDPTTIAHRMERRLRMVSERGLIVGEFETHLGAYTESLAGLIAVTHIDGMASAAGYDQQPMRIVGRVINLDRMSILLTVLDVGHLVGYSLTPRQALLADAGTASTYAAATAAEKRDFAYLADETSLAFVNGDPAKELVGES